jgi:hypothetical protein
VKRQTPPTRADADAEFAAFEAVIARLNATRALPARNAWEALALAERGRGARVLLKDAPAPDSDGLAFAGHAIAVPEGRGNGAQRGLPKASLVAAIRMAVRSAGHRFRWYLIL